MASEITEDEFTEEDFNRYRITKCEIEVVLQALKELFIALWNKDYSNEPWTNDKASVERFEVKVKKACNNRAASYSDPKKEKQKIKRTLAGLQNDGSWYRCDWDISILSKVLVDCRLFNLERISVELSDHIKGIAYIRNKMAHSTAFGLEEQVFKDTMKSFKEHLEGLRCLISVDPHIHTLEQLESQDKPTSGRHLKDMSYAIDLMKLECKIYQEREQRHHDREVLQKKIHNLKKRIADQQSELVRLRTKNADLQKDLNETKTNSSDNVNNKLDTIIKLTAAGLVILSSGLLVVCVTIRITSKAIVKKK